MLEIKRLLYFSFLSIACNAQKSIYLIVKISELEHEK